MTTGTQSAKTAEATAALDGAVASYLELAAATSPYPSGVELDHGLAGHISAARSAVLRHVRGDLDCDSLVAPGRLLQPEDYPAFLATLCWLGVRNPDYPWHVRQVGAILEGLQAPGTIVAVQRKVSQSKEYTGDLVIGRVVGGENGTRAKITGTTLYMGLLVMDVALSTAANHIVRPEVATSDLVHQYEHPTPKNNLANTWTRVGANAVKELVDEAFMGERAQREFPPTPFQQRVCAALCRGGVRMAELGYDDELIEERRAAVIRDLHEVLAGTRRYGYEVVKLGALSASNREAYALVNAALAVGDRKVGLDPRFMEDLRLLQNYQEPAESLVQ